MYRDIPCGRQTLKKRFWKEYRLHVAKLYLCKLRQLPWQAGREVKPRYKIQRYSVTVRQAVWQTATGEQYPLHVQSAHVIRPHMYVARLDLTNYQVETVFRQLLYIGPETNCVAAGVDNIVCMYNLLICM